MPRKHFFKKSSHHYTPATAPRASAQKRPGAETPDRILRIILRGAVAVMMTATFVRMLMLVADRARRDQLASQIALRTILCACQLRR